MCFISFINFNFTKYKLMQITHLELQISQKKAKFTIYIKFELTVASFQTWRGWVKFNYMGLDQTQNYRKIHK